MIPPIPPYGVVHESMVEGKLGNVLNQVVENLKEKHLKYARVY